MQLTSLLSLFSPLTCNNMSQANNSHINIPSPQLSHASQPNNNSQSSHFVRRLIIALVLVFVTVSAISLIAWLIIHPKCPVIKISSFSVSNFNFSNDSRIKADYDFDFSINNTNKKGSLVINSFKLFLLYKETLVTKRLMLERVYLKKTSQQNGNLKFSKDFGERLHRREFNEIRLDWSNRVVRFNVKMEISSRFRSGNWLTRGILMKVSCMDLVVEFLEPGDIGKLKGGTKDCSVNFA